MSNTLLPMELEMAMSPIPGAKTALPSRSVRSQLVTDVGTWMHACVCVCVYLVLQL